MTPILFGKTATVFTSNGIGRLVDCISCTVTEERNGIYECEFQYPITGKWYQEMIANGGIIGVIHDDNHDIQPFDIYKSTAPIDGVVTFYAHHISYRLNNIILQPFTASTASAAVAAITTNSLNSNPFTFSTDKSVTATFDLQHPASVRSILFGQEGSLLDVYGTAEFKFDKFNVQMLVNRGTDTGVTVRYGKNMTSIEQTIDDSGTYNAIAPYWTDGTEYVYTNPIIVQPTTPLTPLKPVSLDISNRFTEKPSAADVATIAQAMLDNQKPWNRTENIKIDFIAMWQSPEYENVAAIQRVGLCDTVSVYYTELGIVAEKQKVVKVVFDVLAERFNEMELGDLSTAYVAIDDGTKQSNKYISTENGALYEPGTYEHNGNWCFGFVTTGGTLLVLFCGIPKIAYGLSLSNVSVTANDQIRTSQGGYIQPTTSNMTGEVVNYGSCIMIVFTKNTGWGVTNNSLVGGRIGIKYTLS